MEPSSSHLQTPPLRFPKFDVITQESEAQDAADPPKSGRPDTLNLSPSPFFSSDTLQSNADLSSPKYFSTPKLGIRDRRSLIRYNSQPARRICFARASIEDSPRDEVLRTPDLDFTKLQSEAITPDSGFSTPAVDGFDSITSSPVLPMGTGLKMRKCGMSMFSSPSLSISGLSAKGNASSSREPSFLSSRSCNNYRANAAAADEPLQNLDLEKSIDLRTWLNSFCQTQTTSASSCSSSTKMTAVQTKPKISLSQPSQSTCQGKSDLLPRVLSMRHLTPIPVIMAPTLPKFTTGVQESSAFSAANSQKRKVLEELQPNTLRTQQFEDERPNHSYMDLIKMALESATDGQMTLKEIVSWIEDHFPFFKLKAKHTWKNSIRHNLSLHHDFIKVEEKRHGGKWKLAADAKKYAYRIPKPPVVKPPPKPASVVCVKRRKSGPQPILPKTVPYALVPIALAPYGLRGTMQDSLAEDMSHAEVTSTSYSCQAQGQEQHLEPQLPQQYQKPQLLHRDKRQQQQPSHELLQTGPQPKEVKLHFRLTQEQKQQLRMEKAQQQRSSLLGSYKVEALRKPKQSESFRRSKFQPSNSRNQNFPLVHMSDYRRNQGFGVAPTKPQPIAPKAIPQPNGETSPITQQSMKSNCYPNSDASNSSSQLLANRLQDSTVHSMPNQAKQIISKNKSICRILARMPKSKSFDAVVSRKVLRDRSKKSQKQVNPKAVPVMNLASMIREDMQAAEEINKILQQKDDDFPRSICDGNLPQNRHELHRPDSEPGKDLLLQAWEETMSPLVMDEDSQGSCLSSGMENDSSLSFSLGQSSGPSLIIAGKSWHTENTLSVVANANHNTCRDESEVSLTDRGFAYSMPRTSIVNIDSTPTSSVLAQSKNSSNSRDPVAVHNKTPFKSFPNTETSASIASSITHATYGKAVSDLHSSEAQGKCECPSTLPQRRPGLYRTKSRRKQIHVPLMIDLSPKRDSVMLDESKQSLSGKKTSDLEHGNEEAIIQDIGQQQICSTELSGPISFEKPHICIQHNLYESSKSHDHFLTKEKDKNHHLSQNLPASPANQESADLLSPVFGSKTASGEEDISSSLDLYQSMSSPFMATNHNPSRQSFLHPSTDLSPSSHTISQEMSLQTSALMVQTAKSIFSPNLSTSHKLDKKMSFQYSVNNDVSFNSDPSFVNSSSYPLLLESELPRPIANHSDLSIYREDIGPKPYISNSAKAPNTDSSTLHDTLSSATVCDFPQHLVEQGNTAEKSCQFFQENVPPTSEMLNQEIPITESLHSHLNTQWRLSEGHYSRFIADGFSPQSSCISSLLDTNHVNVVKSFFYQDNLLHTNQNRQDPKDGLLPHILPAINSFDEGAEWNQRTVKEFRSFNPFATSSILQHQNQGAPAISGVDSTTFLQQYQEGYSEPGGNCLSNSSTYDPGQSNFPLQCQASYQNSAENVSRSAATDFVSVIVSEYPESNAGSSPPGDVLDTRADDSSFLNSSVFDNIDSLMQTSLTEQGSPLKQNSFDQVR